MEYGTLLRLMIVHDKHRETILRRKVFEYALNNAQNRWVEISEPWVQTYFLHLFITCDTHLHSSVLELVALIKFR